MDIEIAKEIVEMLAHGIDPSTGELFPPDSHYNNPVVIRALFTILTLIRMPEKLPTAAFEEKQKDNLENGRPRNAGLPWSKEERKELSSMFESGKTINDLSEYFERTYGAIKSQLTHQGLIK